jgi:hypothetical protein
MESSGLPGHPKLKHVQKLVNRHVVSDNREWVERQVFDKQRFIIVAVAIYVDTDEILAGVS